MPDSPQARYTRASNLRQNGLAIMMYCDDNQGWLPLSDWRTPTLIRASNTGALPHIYMDGRLLFKKYGMTLKTLTCPSGSWAAKHWANQQPLAINYYYNGGWGDWPRPNNHWYGRWGDVLSCL